MAIQVKILRPEGMVPTKKYFDDGGWDLYLPRRVSLAPGFQTKVGLGIAMLVPTGWTGLIRPRSSTNEQGLHVVGTIDRYTGEIFLVLRNLKRREPLTYEAHDRVAQFIPVWTGAGMHDCMSGIMKNFENMGMDYEQRYHLIQQCVLKQLAGCDMIKVVDEFEGSSRGDNGYGSSGR